MFLKVRTINGGVDDGKDGWLFLSDISDARWFDKIDGPRLITFTDMSGTIKNVAVEEVAYLLNDNGKTIETIYGR